MKYEADVDDADALMQPLIWLRLRFPPSVQQLQLQLLTNIDDDKSFKISAGSFIVLAADQHEVLCRSCGREVGNFELKLN